MTQPCLKPMPDQILELNRLLQSILNDIENNMPAALSPKVFFPIKEEPISDTEANKENIPPTPVPFNFEQDLIPLYNKEFTNPMLYHLHNQQNFIDLTDDTNLCMFDSAYCCHHLLSEQEKALNTMKLALTNMQSSLNTMISDAHHFDLRYTDNACARIPALVKKGLKNGLQKILPSQPPQIIIHPGTPANSVQSEPLPTPAPAPKPKKGNCPDCHLPYQYDHAAWC